MQIGRHRCGGYTYLLLLLAIAVIGMAASTALSVGATMTRRDAERELLAIGLEFQKALRSYAGTRTGAAMSTSGNGPRSLEDLLKDPRAPSVRRHLRQIYADPLTGKAEWGLLKDAQGHIVGVHSLAEGRPIQRTEFPADLSNLQDAETYSQWVFALPAMRAAGTSPPPSDKR